MMNFVKNMGVVSVMAGRGGADDKETEVLAVAERLFFRHGYRKVTMVDIAEEAGMSRPTLYAAFGSKEAIFAAFLRRESARHDAETSRQLAGATTLRERLEHLFEIWLLGPFASVIDSENGSDLLANCAVYAPEAAADLYGRFEAHLTAVLHGAMGAPPSLTAPDLARILVLATRELKAHTTTLAEFRRLTDGLITMAIATVAAAPGE